MQSQDSHVSDQELLLLADGELLPSRSAEVRSHLEACWKCRTRVKEIEGTIADFVYMQRVDLDHKLPPIDGSRALLKARLAQDAAVEPKRAWLERLVSMRSHRGWAYACVVVATVASLIIMVNRERPSFKSSLVSVKAGPIPNSRLTPGAIRQVTRSEICSPGYRDMNRTVLPSVQQAVFKKYGILGARREDFEVDYLITPELGGADDLQNLWPEPYTSTDWGAHVKDALEDRLHQMVCEGKIDLATAQREIADNWISAYKKYFHTERPLINDSAKPQEPESEIGDGKST